MDCQRWVSGVSVLVSAVVAIAASPLASFAQQGGNTNQQNTQGQQGQGMSAASEAMQIGSMISGDERFLRENRDPGTLVGGQTEGVGNLRGQTGQAGSSNRQTGRTVGGQSGRSRSSQMNQLGRFGSMFNSGMFNSGRGGSTANQRQNLRVPVRLGFTPINLPGAPQVAQRVQTRLNSLPQLNATGSMSVQVEGRVAVIRGQVASPHERDLAARMLLLEPGISDVRNELLVVSAAATP